MSGPMQATAPTSASGPTEPQPRWRQAYDPTSRPEVKQHCIDQADRLLRFLTGPLAPEPGRQTADPIVFKLEPYTNDERVAAIYDQERFWLPFESLVSALLFHVFSHTGLQLLDRSFRAYLAALLPTRVPREATRTITFGDEIAMLWDELVRKRVFPADRSPVVLSRWGAVPLRWLFTELFGPRKPFALPDHSLAPVPGQVELQSPALPAGALHEDSVTGLATPPLDASPLTTSSNRPSDARKVSPLASSSADGSGTSTRRQRRKACTACASRVQVCDRLVVCTGCVERFIETVAKLAPSDQIPTDYGCVYPVPSGDHRGEPVRESAQGTSTSASAGLDQALQSSFSYVPIRPPALPPLPPSHSYPQPAQGQRAHAPMGLSVAPNAQASSSRTSASSGSRTASSHVQRSMRQNPHPNPPPAFVDPVLRGPAYPREAARQSGQRRIVSDGQVPTLPHRPVGRMGMQPWKGSVHPCCGRFNHDDLCPNNPELRWASRSSDERAGTPAPVLQTPEQEQRNLLWFHLTEWHRKIGKPPGYVFTKDIQTSGPTESDGSSLIPLSASPSRMQVIILTSQCPEMAEDPAVRAILDPLLEKEGALQEQPGWTA